MCGVLDNRDEGWMDGWMAEQVKAKHGELRRYLSKAELSTKGPVKTFADTITVHGRR